MARAEYDAAIAERDQALAQNHRLQHMLHQLQRMQPGRRSEKLDQDQLQLAFEDVEQAVAVTEAADDKHDPVGARECAEKCRANRGALPAHLPRIHVMIAPEDTNRACCRSPMHVIGEDVAERLDVIPGPVPGDRDAPDGCRACEEAVVQAPAPERLIKGGLRRQAMRPMAITA